MVSIPRIVLDTNVIVAAMRSRQGASHRILRLIDRSVYEIALSVPVYLEYQDVCHRHDLIALSPEAIDAILDYICLNSVHIQVHYLWRPQLQDMGDDMLLELAVAGQCPYIVTHNIRDFTGSIAFGIRAITPMEFLDTIGVQP